MKWGRGSAAGPDVVAVARLDARIRGRERLLAMASTTDGDVVGGTDRALYLPDGVVLGWHEIDQAAWLQDDASLEVVTLPIDGPARAYRIALVEPGRLPELARERITSTVVVSQHVPFEGRRGVRVVGRRTPDHDELDWVVVYDKGIDADDEDVRERVRGVVAVLRSNLGV